MTATAGGITGDPPPIDDYGMVGDTRTAALVATNGAIDWLCIPSFDGESVFGRLVGGRAAGTFRLGPAGPAMLTARRYRPQTATLETTWDSPDGQLTLVDAMVAEVAGRLLPTTLLVRRLSASGGLVKATIDFDPRLGERHERPRSERRGEVLVCQWRGIAIGVHASPDIAIEPGKPVTVHVAPGRPLTIAVCVADREPLVHVDPPVPGVRCSPTNDAGRRGAGTSRTRCPDARPSSAAFSRYGC